MELTELIKDYVNIELLSSIKLDFLMENYGKLHNISQEQIQQSKVQKIYERN